MSRYLSKIKPRLYRFDSMKGLEKFLSQRYEHHMITDHVVSFSIFDSDEIIYLCYMYKYLRYELVFTKHKKI